MDVAHCFKSVSEKDCFETLVIGEGKLMSPPPCCRWSATVQRFWVLKKKKGIRMFRNRKSIKMVGLAFVLSFFVATIAQADYVYMGTMRPGCADIGCYKTSVSPSPGKNKTSTAYLNLAQAFRSANVQSQKSRPQSSVSSSTNIPTPQNAKTVAPGSPILNR